MATHSSCSTAGIHDLDGLYALDIIDFVPEDIGNLLSGRLSHHSWFRRWRRWFEQLVVLYNSLAFCNQSWTINQRPRTCFISFVGGCAGLPIFWILRVLYSILVHSGQHRISRLTAMISAKWIGSSTLWLLAESEFAKGWNNEDARLPKQWEAQRIIYIYFSNLTWVLEGISNPEAKLKQSLLKKQVVCVSNESAYNQPDSINSYKQLITSTLAERTFEGTNLLFLLLCTKRQAPCNNGKQLELLSSPSFNTWHIWNKQGSNNTCNLSKSSTFGSPVLYLGWRNRQRKLEATITARFYGSGAIKRPCSVREITITMYLEYGILNTCYIEYLTFAQTGHLLRAGEKLQSMLMYSVH